MDRTQQLDAVAKAMATLGADLKVITDADTLHGTPEAQIGTALALSRDLAVAYMALGNAVIELLRE